VAPNSKVTPAKRKNIYMLNLISSLVRVGLFSLFVGKGHAQLVSLQNLLYSCIAIKHTCLHLLNEHSIDAISYDGEGVTQVSYLTRKLWRTKQSVAKCDFVINSRMTICSFSP
jgi:hypothetical protein